MLIVKAYSVRFAEDRNSQRPSATTHLTCRMPTLPFGSLALRSPSARSRPWSRPPRPRPVPGSCRIRCCPASLSGRLDDDLDPDATPGGPHQGVPDMRDAVDGVADERDPLAGRIEHLEDGLFRVAVGDGLAAGSRPDQLDGLAPVSQTLQMGRRPEDMATSSPETGDGDESQSSTNRWHRLRWWACGTASATRDRTSVGSDAEMTWATRSTTSPGTPTASLATASMMAGMGSMTDGSAGG